MQEKVIRFGIISTAGISRKLKPAFEDSKLTELVAVASRSLEKSKQWTKENNCENIKTYGTYEELLADKDIDAVYIPLPTGLKFEWAKKSVESGKHILVEKPLCGSVDTKQLQELLALCAQNNKQFMDCTMFTHSSRQDVLREKINSGEIGHAKKVISNFSFKSDESFMQGNIRGNASLEPLGALGDMTWYSSMAAIWTFNFEAPEKVQALSWIKNESGVYTEFCAALYYSQGRMAYIDGTFEEAHRQNFEIVGPLGSYRVDDFVGGNNQDGDGSCFWTRFNGGGNYKYFNRDGKLENRETEKSDHVVNMVNDFANKINNNDKTQEWGKRTLLNQQIMVQLNLSAIQDGKILNFDSQL